MRAFLSSSSIFSIYVVACMHRFTVIVYYPLVVVVLVVGWKMGSMDLQSLARHDYA
jgi:hypothetical protein